MQFHPFKFSSPVCRVRPMGLTEPTVSAYLSHPCLQNLEPCLRFQFRLHQPCGKGACRSGSCQPHAGWTYFKGASSQAGEAGPGSSSAWA